MLADNIGRKPSESEKNREKKLIIIQSSFNSMFIGKTTVWINLINVLTCRIITKEKRNTFQDDSAFHGHQWWDRRNKGTMYMETPCTGFKNFLEVSCW